MGHAIAPLIIRITMLDTVLRYAKTRLIGDNPFNHNCIEKNFKSYDFNLIRSVPDIYSRWTKAEMYICEDK